MVSHNYLTTTCGHTNRKGQIGILLCLFACSIWQVWHALPSDLYAMLIDSRRFDQHNGINVTTINPTPLRLQSKDNAFIDPLELEEESHENATKFLNKLRLDFETTCNHNDTNSMKVRALQGRLQSILTPVWFTPPSELPKLEENDPVKPCRYTFLDLGANVGKYLTVSSSTRKVPRQI